MKNTMINENRAYRLVLAVLIAAMVLCFAACGQTKAPSDVPSEGTKSFTFEVVERDGSVKTFDIVTSAGTVGEALIEEGLIQGEAGPYGLYVKTVNGGTYDYDADGCYWAFYVNGEYGMSSVEQTEIEEGAVYAFKVE